MSVKFGFIKNNLNQYAFIYRLIDILFIQIILTAAIIFFEGAYNKKYFVLALLANISYMFFAELFVLYRSWRNRAFKEMLFYVSASWTLAMFPIFIFLFFSKQAEEYSRLTIASWYLLSWLSLCCWRGVYQLLIISWRKKGYNTRNVGILGLTQRGCDLANEIIEYPENGYKLEAIFDERKSPRSKSKFDMYLKGSVNDCIEMAKNGNLDVLFIALPLTNKKRLQLILKELGDTTVDVHIVPDIFTFNLLHSRMGHVGNVQTISIHDNPLRGGYSMMKRIEDVLLSMLILLGISIPMMIIAIAIKLSSKGPVLFKQDRYGIDGKRIKVWKFRSMTTLDNGKDVKQAKKNDPRITKLGALLRKTSLDELPQFFNVLQGEMSIVGPRPHAVSHNEEYRKKVAYYMLRHKIKPGITGWAQVNGWRGETDTVEKMEMRVKYDLDYINNWSIWMDFKIIVFTFYKGFSGKNAY